MIFLKTEVHVLLLTDMLLLCKLSTKKASVSGSGSAGGGLKIIRQPYVVDRIRVHELKEPSSLGLVYLNEYNAASGALVLSAGEPKLAKVRNILTFVFIDIGLLIYLYRFPLTITFFSSLRQVLDGVVEKSTAAIRYHETSTAQWCAGSWNG